MKHAFETYRICIFIGDSQHFASAWFTLTVVVKVYLMCLSCLERAKVMNGLSVEPWLLGVNPLSGMSAMHQPASVSHQ